MAARARRDPAAEGGELEGLREMPERQAGRLQLAFQIRPQHAGLNACRARHRVDFQHFRHAPHVDGQHRLESIANDRLDAADDARSAAERDHRGAGAVGPVEQSGDVVLALRKGDDVGRGAVIAAIGADVIGIGFAVSVRGAVVGLGRADGAKRRRRFQARRGEADLGQCRRRDVTLRRNAGQPTDALGDGACIGFAKGLVFMAPTPEFQTPFGHISRARFTRP